RLPHGLLHIGGAAGEELVDGVVGVDHVSMRARRPAAPHSPGYRALRTRSRSSGPGRAGACGHAPSRLRHRPSTQRVGPFRPTGKRVTLASRPQCGPPSAPTHEKCAVRSFPLPIALTARLSPVVVLAAAGWALSSGPLAAPQAAEKPATEKKTQTQSASAPSATQEAKTYTAAPAPCTGIPKDTIKSLVPNAK